MRKKQRPPEIHTESGDTTTDLIDVLGCHSVTPGEFCSICKKKADRNLNRW